KLEEIVGREKFDIFLSEYFEANAFKTMTTDDFISYTNENLFEKNNIVVDSALYKDWIFGEGLPDGVPMVSSERFEKVDTALLRWNSGTAATELSTHEWSTHEWLHFIGNLPEDMSQEQMKALDKAFGFT